MNRTVFYLPLETFSASHKSFCFSQQPFPLHSQVDPSGHLHVIHEPPAISFCSSISFSLDPIHLVAPDLSGAGNAVLPPPSLLCVQHPLEHDPSAPTQLDHKRPLHSQLPLASG